MGRKKTNGKIESFHRVAVQNGITYAEAQKRETQAQMKRIRAPRTERSNGEPVSMTVAARNILKNIREVNGI